MAKAVLGVLSLSVVFMECSAQWDFKIDHSTGAYSIDVDGVNWIGSTANMILGAATDTGFTYDFVITGHTVESGQDKMGAYQLTCFAWNSSILETCYQVYPDSVLFTTRYPQGWKISAPGNSGSVLTAFPTLSLIKHDNVELGYAQWWHTFLFRQTMEIWGGGKNPTVGPDAGPICLFRRDMKHTIVLSPYDNFMTSNTRLYAGSLQYGVMGTITNIPIGFSHSVIFHYKKEGLRRTLFSWGSILQNVYNKKKVDNAEHTTLSRLGYSTDHGAAYYYKTETNKTYETTLLDLAASYQAADLPISYALLDSWWYYQGVDKGTVKWVPMEGIFPHGMGWLSEQTKWSFQLHNRYWSSSVAYAQQNGGAYPWTIEHGDAVPDTQLFWDDLMANASTQWNMITYEQDWLYAEWMTLNDTMLGHVGNAEKWLLQMDAGAAKVDVSIQMCMAWPRFALMGVKMDQVTQIRASDDYTNDLQWYIGFSSLLVAALGMKPSKDSFRSVMVQPDRTEPYTYLQAAVAALSGGPSAISDTLNYTDTTLIRMSMTQEGLLLYPDIPGVAIDALSAENAFPTNTSAFSHGAAVQLSTSIVSGVEWHSLLTASFVYEHVFDIASAPLVAPTEEVLYDVYHVQDADIKASGVTTYTIPSCSPNPPFPCNKTHVPVLTFAPKMHNGWSLLGEKDKWVSVSKVRFASVVPAGQGLEVVLKGTEGEVVTVQFGDPSGAVVSRKVVFTQSGVATVSVP